MTLLDLIHGAEKYAPIARFLGTHADTVVDLAKTDAHALAVIEKADPTIIPHIEELTADLVKAAGAPPTEPGGADPHVAAKHVVAKALVRPTELSPGERAWMDRAASSGG